MYVAILFNIYAPFITYMYNISYQHYTSSDIKSKDKSFSPILKS